MAWQPEDLTAQIDGLVDTFTTTFARTPAQLIVFHNTVRLPDSMFSEPTDQTIKLTFVPSSGDTLFVNYLTDQTFDGRVRGFIQDPATLPPGSFPESLVQLLDGLDNRLDALEAIVPELPVLSGTDGFVLTEEQPGGTLAFKVAPGAGGGSLSDLQVDKFIPTTNGQTVFGLAFKPADPADVMVYVNGQAQVKDTDFTITGGTSQVLTWLDNEHTLETSDVLLAHYARF